MNVVVIGGAGFIGVHTANRFAEKGNDVVIVDNLSRPGSEHNLKWIQAQHPRITFIRCDITQDLSLLQESVKGADVIFHLAAQVAVTTSVKDPREDFKINALGSLNVMETVRQTAPKALVIYSSTNKVYGDLEQVPMELSGDRYVFSGDRQGISEKQLLDFYSPYGCSKGAADQYVHDYHRIYGIPTIVFRQSCIYGQRQFGNEDQGWLAWFAVATMLGKPLTIYGNGKQVRDVLYAEDLVDAYVLAVEKREQLAGSIFNMGGGPGNTLSLLELITALETYFKRPIKPAYEQERPGDQRIYVSDLSLAKEKLGWTPNTPLSIGLTKMLDWIKENEALIRERMGGPAHSKPPVYANPIG